MLCFTHASSEFSCKVQGFYKLSTDSWSACAVLSISSLAHIFQPNKQTNYLQFVRYGHFYSAPLSPLLLRGAPDYSTDTVSEFHAEAHRQLQVKDLPKVPT